MRNPKKLKLQTRVVANLTKAEMKSIVGGREMTIDYTCGTNCVTISAQCAMDHPWHPMDTVTPVSLSHCLSWDPPGSGNTCNGVDMQGDCGSDVGTTCINSGGATCG